jgi:hypothetical protein
LLDEDEQLYDHAYMHQLQPFDELALCLEEFMDNQGPMHLLSM